MLIYIVCIRCGKMAAINAKSIVMMVVAGLVLSAAAPLAISNISTANQTGWTSSSKSLWNILPLVFVAAILIGVVGFFGHKKGMFSFFYVGGAGVLMVYVTQFQVAIQRVLV